MHSVHTILGYVGYYLFCCSFVSTAMKLYAVGRHLPYGITVLPATRHKWTHPP